MQYKNLPVTLSDPRNAACRQPVYPCVSDFLFYVETDLAFLGPGKGRTHSVLSVSTSATLGHRFPAWFTSGLIFFLSPLFLLVVAVSRSSALQYFDHDPQSVGLGISLVSGYWGLTLLVLGMCHVDTSN